MLVLLVTKSNAVHHEAVENVIAAQQRNGIFAQCLPAFGHPDLRSCRGATDRVARHDRAPYVWRAMGAATDTQRKCGRPYAGGEYALSKLSRTPTTHPNRYARELLDHDDL